jgi:hypothetical protein
VTLNQKIPWKRVAIEALAIVGSILLAFAIDAWWDELRDREDTEILLSSLHDELVQVEEFMSWHDQYVGAIRDSARQLLTAAVGLDQELGERKIDRLLADLTYIVSDVWFEVPELNSLVLNDDFSLIEDRDLRRRLKSWKAQNDFFRYGVRLQEKHVNDRFMPFLEENASLQQIYNADEHLPGFPVDTSPLDKIELRELRSHSPLLDDPVFQNLLTRRIGRMDNMLDARNERYVPELRELIALVEQELDE